MSASLESAWILGFSVLDEDPNNSGGVSLRDFRAASPPGDYSVVNVEITIGTGATLANLKTRSKGLAIAMSIGVALLCGSMYSAPTTNIRAP
ncbi:MAG TPA: hypothetical protein VJ810_28710 [Blastocatellia bacterium]|nr:hypothetical protein [Blastocatellia bacterium]